MGTVPRTAVHIAGQTWVIPGLTNAGFVEGLAIDTNEDETVYQDVPVDSLVITHGHADHFSAGHVIRSAGAKVYAARDDASMVENPDINVRGMFSWAKPSDRMTTKLFKGTGCRVDGLFDDWRDERATTIHLPGHTLGHTGLLTRDRVLFSGDALYLSDLWEQHPMPYAIDPGMVVASLEKIRGIECDWIVPAHGHAIPREELEHHIDFHIGQVYGIRDLLTESLRSPMTTEQVIAYVIENRNMQVNQAAYWLAVTNVKAYLGEMLGLGIIEFYVEGATGWWHTTD